MVDIGQPGYNTTIRLAQTTAERRLAVELALGVAQNVTRTQVHFEGTAHPKSVRCASAVACCAIALDELTAEETRTEERP